MKSQFVRSYLLAIAAVLVFTALAKFPAIFHARTWCLDDPILGNFQPQRMSNEQLLGIAAGVELVIVGLICFSPWRWLPCLAVTLWGLACYFAHLILIDPYANCRCLGWFMQPGPSTNQTAAWLALGIAAGGWIAFRTAWHARKIDLPAESSNAEAPPQIQHASRQSAGVINEMSTIDLPKQ